ncbi:MAG: hypothetical protein IT423_05110 [Pirellulaceae bacterium]|nr:hypothetical protein [Pirellulaceae bacterium]
MAKCEEGYLCEVCGGDVEHLRDSALYLQFILGWIDPETLHTRRELHIDCAPVLAQFIDDPSFGAQVSVPAEFAKDNLDGQFARERTAEVSRAYRRLRELDAMPDRPPVIEYLLPEFASRWQ